MAAPAALSPFSALCGESKSPTSPYCPPALNRAKAQHACVLRPPERGGGGAGCQLKNAHDRHTAIYLGGRLHMQHTQWR